MPEVPHALRQLVDAVHPLPQEAWADFATIWKPYTARRKEMLLAAGERAAYLYFVQEGVQRVYWYDDQGREATLVFTYAPSFGGVLDALLLRQSSRYYYEALTPSVFLRASVEDLFAQMQAHSAVEVLVRQGLTHALAGVLERLVELQCYSSEEKLRELLRRSPHMLQRVPHKYLANYLGIDATNFSKLINQIRI
ncbi:Crp/Fnr family transcriptional regulator [Rhabdobacter roseus]|uniref:CRP-like cAMP-binding protein n=1 Tax=Rhabdobacter roseus TaxID=1655419 RepID=A0A840TUH3_9BACT|nr:Crp/Fnr family transcriptional regulator [Rhabdobacter roseus]MBB5285317.1 CRP-like cAMP-binding protein [Rhabdobacter roseus]